jgi:hypothetical protein
MNFLDVPPVLPASSVLLRTLHLAAFVLFLVPMNLALGWPLLTLAAEAIGRWRHDTSLRRLAVWLARRTGGAIALAAATAFPVYLLSVARYGWTALPAGRLMGWVTLMAIPVLLAGCGGAFWVALRRRGSEPSTLKPFLPDVVESYILAFRRRGLERPGLVLTAVVALCMLAVEFVFVSQAILASRPDLWAAVPGMPTGMFLPVRDPQLAPRLLVILAGALAVSAFFVAWHGADHVKDGEFAYGRAVLVFGAVGLAIPVVLQIAAGTWFVLSLPPSVSATLSSGSPSGYLLLWGAAAAAVAVAVLALVAATASSPCQYIYAGAVILFYSLASMTLVRERIREALLIAAKAVPVKATVCAQPEAVTVFVVVAVLGAAAIAYMVAVSSPSRRE